LFLVPKTLARIASIIERSRYRVEIRFFYSSAGGAGGEWVDGSMGRGVDLYFGTSSG